MISSRFIIFIGSLVSFICLFLNSCKSPSDQNDNYNDNFISIKGKKIGYSSPSLNAPYYKALLKSIKDNVLDNNMKFVFRNAEDNPQKQIDDINEMITKGIDILLLNPKNPEMLLAATKNLESLNIPVFIIDGSINQVAEYVTNIQSNNEINGQLVGNWLAKKLGPKKMKIALLSGVKGNPVGMDRRDSVLKGLINEQLNTFGFTNFEIVSQYFTNWSYEGSKKAINQLIKDNQNINVIIAESDVCVLGGIKELDKAKKIDDILIVAAADGQKEAVKYIIDTDFYGCTAMNGPSIIGKTAVIYAIQYLKGRRKFLEKTLTPPYLITKDNAVAFYNEASNF